MITRSALSIAAIVVSCSVPSFAVDTNPLCSAEVFYPPSLNDLKFALDSGAEPNERCIPDQGEWGHGDATPLFAAGFAYIFTQAEGKDPSVELELIRILLERGADPNIADSHGETLLEWLVLARASVDPLLLLLQHGASPDANSGAALKMAASGSVGSLTLLGASSETKNNLAAEMAQVLLSACASPNLSDMLRRTAAHKFASGYAGPNMLDVLLSFGLDFEARDHDGKTPLHIGAAEGWPDQVKALLDHGANIEAEDNEGRLHSALASTNFRLELYGAILDRLGVPSSCGNTGCRSGCSGQTSCKPERSARAGMCTTP